MGIESKILTEQEIKNYENGLRTGFILIQKAREILPKIPVVFYTTLESGIIHKSFKDAGYLKMPARSSEIIQEVKKVLNPKKRVLIIDQGEGFSVFGYWQNFFKNKQYHNFDLYIATTDQEAIVLLEKFQNERLDLIIANPLMTTQNSSENQETYVISLLIQYEIKNRNIPILIYTSIPEEKEWKTQLGRVLYVKKPEFYKSMATKINSLEI